MPVVPSPDDDVTRVVPARSAQVGPTYTAPPGLPANAVSTGPVPARRVVHGPGDLRFAPPDAENTVVHGARSIESDRTVLPPDHADQNLPTVVRPTTPVAPSAPPVPVQTARFAPPSPLSHPVPSVPVPPAALRPGPPRAPCVPEPVGSLPADSRPAGSGGAGSLEPRRSLAHAWSLYALCCLFCVVGYEMLGSLKLLFGAFVCGGYAMYLLLGGRHVFQGR